MVPAEHWMVSIRHDPIKTQTSVSKFVSKCLGGLTDVAVFVECSLMGQSECGQISILNTLHAWLAALSKHIQIRHCFKPLNGHEVGLLKVIWSGKRSGVLQVDCDRCREPHSTSHSTTMLRSRLETPWRR